MRGTYPRQKKKENIRGKEFNCFQTTTLTDTLVSSYKQTCAIPKETELSIQKDHFLALRYIQNGLIPADGPCRARIQRSGS